MVLRPPQQSALPSESSLTEGRLAVFDQDSQAQVAVITGIKTSKAKLFSMRGRAAEIPLNRIDGLPGKIPAELSSSEEKAKFLLNLRDEALEKALQFPVEELWSFVEEEEKEFPIGELTSLYFGENTLENHLILRFALYEDKIFFKRKKFFFSPRGKETVEELKKAEEARAVKQRLLEEALEETLQATTSKDVSFSETTERLLRSVEKIAAGAGHIENNEVKDVSHFLEHYEARSGKNLSGNKEERAYRFLQQIGRFHKNTNLSFIRHQLPYPFEDLLLGEANGLRDSFSPPTEGRTDLKELHTVTIDDVDTKDMDDALSVERTENGGYRLGIHIADVASVIAKDSLLDKEALSRATSLYFPEKSVHMFPPAIAEDLCSLVEGEDRATVSCIVEFSREHEIVNSSVLLSTIAVQEKQSYNQVDSLLDPPSGMVGTLYELAMSCEARRLAAGGLKIPKREVRVQIKNREDLAKSDFSLEPYSEQTPARELIGEMMILGNQIMGEFARENGIPFIFRSQEAQDKDAEQALSSIPPGPAYDTALRMTLKRSTTSTAPGPHATLGLPCYTQATSPIRRYTDLVNQRQLVAHLRGEPLPYTEEDIDQVLMETADSFQRARMMNRETHRFWVLKELKKKAERKETLGATVVRDDGPAYQLELDEVFIPVLMKTKEKLKRGDQITVSIQTVDPRYDYLKLNLKK